MSPRSKLVLCEFHFNRRRRAEEERRFVRAKVISAKLMEEYLVLSDTFS
jgi:hypothetical protein